MTEDEILDAVAQLALTLQSVDPSMHLVFLAILAEMQERGANCDRAKKALERLVAIAPKSVEYGDWPELQRAVEQARTVISKLPLYAVTPRKTKAHS